MFKPDNLFSLAASFVVVALVTSLILPGRQTATIITAGSNGFAKNLSTVIAK